MGALKSEALLEELLANQLLIAADKDVFGALVAELPAHLVDRFTLLEVATWGCFLNDVRLSNHTIRTILLQLHSASSHFSRVSALHFSGLPLDKAAQNQLI